MHPSRKTSGSLSHPPPNCPWEEQKQSPGARKKNPTRFLHSPSPARGLAQMGVQGSAKSRNGRPSAGKQWAGAHLEASARPQHDEESRHHAPYHSPTHPYT